MDHDGTAATADGEARYRALFEQSQDAMLLFSGFTCVDCNGKVLELLGCGREDLIGADLSDLSRFSAPAQPGYPDRPGLDEAAARVRESFREALSGVPQVFPWRFLGSGDGPVDVEIALNRIEIGQTPSLVAVGRDVRVRKRSETLLNSLYKISEAAHRQKRLPDLYAAIHGVVEELMPARNFYIALKDEAAGMIRFPYFLDEREPAIEDRRPARGLTEYVLRTGSPLLASGIVLEGLIAGGEVEIVGPPPVDWLGVPLKAGGATLGVLAVQSYSGSIRYGGEEKNLLTFVSEQVAMAIGRVRAEEDLRRHRDRLEELVADRTAELMNTTATLKVEISGREMAERALRESERKFNDLLDLLPDPALIIDRRGRVAAWNRAIAAMTGVPADEMIGRGDHGYALPFFGRRRPMLIDRVNGTGEPADVYEAVHRDPETGVLTGEVHAPGLREEGIYLSATAGPLHDDAGTPIGAIEVIRDITDRKKGEEALRKANAYLENVFDNSADAIVMVNAKGRFVSYNKAAADFFGYRFAELKDRLAFEFYPDPEALDRMLQKLRAEGAVRRYEIEMRRSDGADIPVETSISLLKDEGGRTIGSAAVIRDLSELKKAMKRAQESERMKTDFLSTVSHELRTPLTSVVGFAKIIRKKYESVLVPRVEAEEKKVRRAIDQVRANLDIIISEGERLTALINDVLDIAKMEAGRVEWRMGPRPVGEIVDRARSATAALFEEKNLPLSVAVADPEIPLHCDPDRLIQVFINLFSNAVKFTDQGRITCEVRREGDHLRVEVADEGRGIDPGDREKVFEKFKQVGDTLVDKPRGTGLGLPICREIVERHGGRIWVADRPGPGTTMVFTLPLAPASAAEPAPEPTPGADERSFAAVVRGLDDRLIPILPRADGPRTILVVDDDANIRSLLRQELESRGYRVREAAGGMEALDKVRNEPPDLVVLDVMMPGMDGFDVAAVLKNDPGCVHIPIIILSITEDRERGVRVGVDSYFSKPIDADALLEEVARLTARSRSRRRVLVSGENGEAVGNLAQLLRSRGYEVDEAADGRTCIEKATAVRPDMVIVDETLSRKHDIVQVLRFEKGLENVRFVLMGREGRDAPA